MPTTPEAFIVDTQGIALAITVYDIDGEPVTNCYSDLDSEGSPLEWPLTDYDPNGVTLYFTSPDPPQIRSPYRARIRSDASATDYQVGATLNGVQVGGDDGGYAPVEAHSWMPLSTLTIGFDDYELAHLVNSSGASGQGFTFIQADDPGGAASVGDTWLQILTPTVVFPSWSAGEGGVEFQQTSLIEPSAPNGHCYYAQVGGLGGTVEPTFPVDGSTVTDNEVTWVDQGLITDQNLGAVPVGQAFIRAVGDFWTQLFLIPFIVDENGIPRTQVEYGPGSIDFGLWTPSNVKVMDFSGSESSVSLSFGTDGLSGNALFLQDENVMLAEQGGARITLAGGKVLFFSGPTLGLQASDRPTIATQVDTVDVTAFNALRTALIALGLVIDGD